MIVGSLAAYYLARTHTRLSYGIYLLFLLGHRAAVPARADAALQAHEGPGLLGTYSSMILFYTGLQVPFTIFLYTGFLRALPREYGEAALVDGATHWQSFTHVIFPLLRPITGTVVILNAVFVWNDFLTPLLYLGGTPNRRSRSRLPVRRPVRLQLGLHLRRARRRRRCRSWSSSCSCSATSSRASPAD